MESRRRALGECTKYGKWPQMSAMRVVRQSVAVVGFAVSRPQTRTSNTWRGDTTPLWYAS
jgi:hypothetical protein